MKEIDEICKRGWVDLNAVLDFIEAAGVRKTGHGPRENARDGEAEWVLTAADGAVESFGANYYSGETWRGKLLAVVFAEIHAGYFVQPHSTLGCPVE